MENQAIVQSVDQNNLQSRWGHHPCNRETFLKLKALHKAFWSHLRISVRAERWLAKRPENRRGKEPQFCHQFHVAKKCACVAGVFGMYRKVEEHPVRVLFQQARKPSAEPVTPFDAATLSQIDAWLAELSRWESRVEA